MISGKTIAVTRPKGQEKSFLKILSQRGMHPIHFPLIRISPCYDEAQLRDIFKDSTRYDWVCFTSANGVRYAFDFAQSENKLEFFRNVRMACIGEATAQVLRKFGFSPELVPDYYQAEGLLEAFQREVIAGKRFLLLRAKGSREILREVLEKQGGEVTEIFLYEALPDREGKGQLKKALFQEEVDCITLTSSSTVSAFQTLLDEAKLEKSKIQKVVLASIGPITSASLRSKGLRVNVEAKTYTTEGLAHAIFEFFENKQFAGI